MARLQPGGTSGTKRNQSAMQLRGNRVGLREKAGQLACWMVYGGEDRQESLANTSAPIEIKPEESEAQDVTVLSPSCDANVPLRKIVADHGPSSPYFQEAAGFVYQPPAGFVHCFGAQGLTRLADPLEIQVPTVAMSSQHQAAQGNQPAHHTSSTKLETSQEQLARSKSTKRKYSKRSQSVAPVDSTESDECDEGLKKRLRATTEPLRTFYIGDFPKVIKFLYQRFDDLTTKPLRTMVTAWIKILEPRRQSNYGPYHKQLPSQQPPGCTPPWWPKDVPYNEPSHLSKHNLNMLAVDVMLQHRKIDEIKRSCSWVDKLRKAAEYAVETTPIEFFSSSKNLAFNTKMRERALTNLLPNLFDVAQSYENHIAEHALYEGSGTMDPGTGRKHIWKAISKPPREVVQRKKGHKGKGRSTSGTNCNAEEFGDEIAAGATACPASSRQASMKTPKQSIPCSGAVLHQSRETSVQTTCADQSPPPKPHPNYEPYRPVTIPNTSYPRPGLGSIPYNKHGLQVEVKSHNFNQYTKQVLMYNTNSPSHSLQPPDNFTSCAYLGEDTSPYTDSSLSFTSGPSPTDQIPYPTSYPIVDTSFSTHMNNPVYNAVFSYPCDGLFNTMPMVVHATGSPPEFPNDLDTK